MFLLDFIRSIFCKDKRAKKFNYECSVIEVSWRNSLNSPREKCIVDELKKYIKSDYANTSMLYNYTSQIILLFETCGEMKANLDFRYNVYEYYNLKSWYLQFGYSASFRTKNNRKNRIIHPEIQVQYLF